MTTGPSAGPASAYPTFRTPASICFSGPNDVFVPGLLPDASSDLSPLDCAFAGPATPSPAAATVKAAVRSRRRRSSSYRSDIVQSPDCSKPVMPRMAGDDGAHHIIALHRLSVSAMI